MIRRSTILLTATLTVGCSGFIAGDPGVASSTGEAPGSTATSQIPPSDDGGDSGTTLAVADETTAAAGLDSTLDTVGDGSTTEAAASTGVEPPLALVMILRSDDAQAIVDAHPAGTAFAFEAGVHTGVSILPKDFDTFVPDPRGGRVVLDGGGVLERAFRSDNVVRGVELYDLEITNYVPGAFSGVVDAGSQEWADPEAWNPATDWHLEELHIHHNGGHHESSAIHVGSGVVVLGGAVHDNAGQGVGGHGHTIHIEGVEIAYNSLGVDDSLYWHSGGVKLVIVHDAVIRDCDVHHNVGPGIWFDVNCDDVLVEDNLVHDNGLSGIMFEISRRGTIRGNTLERNGAAEGRGWLWPAAILLSTAYECEVSDNVLHDNVDGMVVIDQRTLRTNGTDIHGPDDSPAFGRLYDDDTGALIDQWWGGATLLSNNSVSDSGQTGATATAAESVGSDVYATTSFVGNQYTEPVTWVWGSGDAYAAPVSLADWTAAGNQ